MARKLFVLIIFAGFLNWCFTKTETIDDEPVYSQISVNSDTTVTLYATQWCGYCKKARKLLEKNNIEYQEYDIETSDQGASQYKALNGQGIPILVINSEVIRGYKPEAIVAALNK